MSIRRYRVPDLSKKKVDRRLTASALAYDPAKDLAPRVVAAGHGKTAENIIGLARKHGIPIYEDPVLATALAAVNPSEEIPPELYLLVAEVLAYIYRIAGKNKKIA